MPAKAARVGGLFTALITPFDAKGEVDEDALASLVKFQLSKRVDGLFVCGSTGLGPMLSEEERNRVVSVVASEAKAGVPVVAQVGAADTSSSVRLAKHAEKAGVDAVASLTPYYYKLNEASIAKHFETISESVSVPLFAYNIPQFTGNNLQPKVVGDLARRKVVVGIKDSSRDFLQVEGILDAVPEEFVVMNGTEEYALFAMMVGADGVVSGGANAFPEIFASMVASYKRGDQSGALEAQRKILAYKEAVKEAPIAAYYEILGQRGVSCGVPRAPFLPLGGQARGRISSYLRGANLGQRELSRHRRD